MVAALRGAMHGTLLEANYFNALCTMPSQLSTAAADKKMSTAQQQFPFDGSRSNAKTSQKLNDIDESQIDDGLLINLLS